jgi:hypothetical protein
LIALGLCAAADDVDAFADRARWRVVHEPVWVRAENGVVDRVWGVGFKVLALRQGLASSVSLGV